MADQVYSQITHLLLQSIRTALQAGEAIMKIYRSGSFRVRSKKDNSPLTEADEAAHHIICKGLEITGIPVLSEEGKNIDYEKRKNWNELWLVDPLDGTKEFLKGDRDFTVNIALIYKNLPVSGVVYAPARNIMYFATENLGSCRFRTVGPEKFEHSDINAILSRSFRLPVRIRRSNKTKVTVSRSHLNAETRSFIQSIKSQSGDLDIMYRGSALKFCLVAEGTADIYPRLGPTSEWDTAAGHAVAVYSGCSVVGHPPGMSLCYNKPVLVNPWFIVRRAGLKIS